MLAAAPDAALDVLALALGAEFRDVNVTGAIARLDVLGAALRTPLGGRAAPRTRRHTRAGSCWGSYTGSRATESTTTTPTTRCLTWCS
jgi:hypothetical protein